MKKLDQSKFLKYFTSSVINIEVVLKHYPTAKYVGQFPLRDNRGEFTDFHAEVFYEPNPKTELGHSNYFAVYPRDGVAYITGASHVEKLLLAVYEDKEGDLIYSRFQHDFRSFESKTGKIMIDGGWWMPVTDTGMFSMAGRTLWDGDSFPRGKSVIIREGEFYEMEEGEVL
jgi:hypothetical protein